MPIYAYRCTQCGHALDALQKLNDAPLTNCPACGAAALKKQLTAPSFRLKGSGWYETDFKRSGQHNVHTNEQGSTESAANNGDNHGAGAAATNDTTASAPASSTE